MRKLTREEAVLLRGRAMDLFKEGYNCAQAVALAFADYVPMEKETLAALSSSFGGGMGRLREVCGAVSGMFMICGLRKGYTGPETGPAKAEHYARIQEMAAAFREKNGTIICRELLGLDHPQDPPVPAKRNEHFYQTRPCAELVGDAAEIAALYLAEEDE
ncbi:MAG: C_GCAxxG_C_C family protein [Clostridia bacterium]|nr:C_GCAxxG_C_C family protein [Clostridia bacterium]